MYSALADSALESDATETYNSALKHVLKKYKAKGVRGYREKERERERERERTYETNFDLRQIGITLCVPSVMNTQVLSLDRKHVV